MFGNVIINAAVFVPMNLEIYLSSGDVLESDSVTAEEIFAKLPDDADDKARLEAFGGVIETYINCAKTFPDNTHVQFVLDDEIAGVAANKIDYIVAVGASKNAEILGNFIDELDL